LDEHIFLIKNLLLPHAGNAQTIIEGAPAVPR
jgi:hypothetical protein